MAIYLFVKLLKDSDLGNKQFHDMVDWVGGITLSFIVIGWDILLVFLIIDKLVNR